MKQFQIFMMIFCLSLLIFSGVSQANEADHNLDEQLFTLINSDLKSPYLDWPMRGITHMGDEVTQAAMVGGFYLTGEKETALLLTSALAKTWWTTSAVKHVVGRPRPPKNLDLDVKYVGNYKKDDSKSFPSGHTTAAFAVATVLTEQYPDYKPYFYTYATLMGVSRVYVGAHYPSDVLIGAGLGYLIGKSTVKYKNLIVNGNFIEYSIKF